MPRKGNMFIGTFEADEGSTETTKSANPTKLGTVLRSDGETRKRWVQKTLKSQQEVLVECMTGEIYRYLIGRRQPKIRTGGLNVIMSEFVGYRAVRAVFDDPDHRHKVRKFATGFCAHLDGFMRVLFSSIMLEENDLSDQNYGLAVANKTDQHTVEADDGFVEVVQSDEDYVEFIKIDHGQSLNSLRAAGSLKALAEIKLFPPPTSANIDPFYGVDKRTKSHRKTIWFTKRKYEISPYFVDACLFDFLVGAIDKDYIKQLQYQPSTLPLFDGRLLTLVKDLPHRYDAFEEAKYGAVAKLVFTKNEVYAGIADRAAHEELAGKQATIKAKILANKAALHCAIATDLDFCAYVAENADAIRDEIRTSFARICSKRGPDQGGKGGASDRYKDLAGVNPIDEAALQAVLRVGQHYAVADLRKEVTALLLVLRNTVALHDWKVTGAGGIELPIRPGETKVLPETAAQMALSLMRFNLSPRRFVFRTLHDMTWLVALALAKKSVFRTKPTQQGYTNLKSIIDDFSRHTPAIRYFWKKYSVHGAERWLDIAALSAEIDNYIRMNLT